MTLGEFRRSPHAAARHSASGSMPARPSHPWVRATVAWFAALAGMALALELVVLTVEIGPLNVVH